MATERKFREINKQLHAILGVLLYLVNTRDERKKGNKLAPEQIMFDLMKGLTHGD